MENDRSQLLAHYDGSGSRVAPGQGPGAGSGANASRSRSKKIYSETPKKCDQLFVYFLRFFLYYHDHFTITFTFTFIL